MNHDQEKKAIYLVHTRWKMLNIKIKAAKKCRDQDPDFGGKRLVFLN